MNFYVYLLDFAFQNKVMSNPNNEKIVANIPKYIRNPTKLCGIQFVKYAIGIMIALVVYRRKVF